MRNPATSCEAAGPEVRTARGSGWVLLPLAWCGWLLLGLVPALLVGPRVAIGAPWMDVETAPAALVAGAIFFLVAIWPFWPALAPAASEGRAKGAWWGRSTLELVILLALAVPFGRVAWAVGGRTIDAAPLVVALAGMVVLAMGMRVAAARWPAAGRWFMALAVLACGLPIFVHYAAVETFGTALPRVLEISPLVGLGRFAIGGAEEAAGWPVPPAVWLWPAVGLMVGGVSILVPPRGRAAHHEAA